MSGQNRLPAGALSFLFIVAILADGTKILLDFLFGVGVVLDPLLITPLTTLVFWITLNHNSVPMFTGKTASVAWTNLVVSSIPVVDALPDWTAYTVYLAVQNRARAE